MRFFIEHFVKAPEGTWICVRSGVFVGPEGAIEVKPGDRFRPGEVVKGIDLANAFDELSANGI